MAVWDNEYKDTPQAKCVINLPRKEGYDQSMKLDWYPLTTSNGKPGGKIKLGDRKSVV